MYKEDKLAEICAQLNSEKDELLVQMTELGKGIGELSNKCEDLDIWNDVEKVFKKLKSLLVEEISGLLHNAEIGKLIKLMSELSEFELYPYQYEMINLLNEFNTQNSLQELSEFKANPDVFSSDISSLKKRIKHCKNFLERKALEKQLNAAYKEIKNRRC